MNKRQVVDALRALRDGVVNTPVLDDSESWTALIQLADDALASVGEPRLFAVPAVSGPWAVDPLNMGTLWNVGTTDGAHNVAIANQVIGDDMKQTRRSANARLIAAAPDLLEALTEIAEMCDPTSHERPRPLTILKLARAALAKAGQ